MSCPLPLGQNKSSCETIRMKMRFVAKFILMQIKLIFTSFAQGLVLKQRQQTTRRYSYTKYGHLPCSASALDSSRGRRHCVVFFSKTLYPQIASLHPDV